jgi:hypothetical protein
MKAQSGAAIQFSGYPLTIAEKQKIREQVLTVVKPGQNDHTTSVQKNSITNDSKNWDIDWFNGYE